VRQNFLPLRCCCVTRHHWEEYTWEEYRNVVHLEKVLCSQL